jgi:NAD(P)-dependent dehydrogenase (short-subunit alcohol dehydrogenase family)
VARLGHPQPRGVDHLEQGLVTGARRRHRRWVVAARVTVEQAAHVVLAQERRQPLRSLRRTQGRHRAARHQAPPHEEPEERPQGGQLAPDGHRVVSTVQRRQIRAAHDRVELPQGGGAAEQLAREGAQLLDVAQVRPQRVHGGPLLGPQVIPERGDCVHHLHPIVAEAPARRDFRGPGRPATGEQMLPPGRAGGMDVAMPTTALVTGGNRGIGLALCRLLKERGAEVLAVCRQPSPELQALGVRLVAGVDVTSDAGVATMAKAVSGALGGTGLDLAILNAGILRHENLDHLDLADVKEQLEVNAMGPLRVAHALLPHLGPGSKLALITSRMGSMGDNGSGGSYGYRMSKAALNAAGVSLAVDLRPRGVAVAILHPGYVRTDMTGGSGNVAPAEAAKMLLARIDELRVETTGRFLHANGEQLPW